MKSPFPGMDPYIEASGLWQDFHDDLIGEIKRALAAVLPDHYLVRTGERSYIVLAEAEGKESHSFLPDVGVTTAPNRTGTAAAIADPAEAVTMRAFIDERHRETFVEIYEASADQRLVTCVEVLSPGNKRRGSEGWEVYQRKRQSLLLGAAHLVEIDLVRGGSKLPMVDPWPASPYAVLVCRRQRAPYCQVWPVHFQQSLPPVPVPLAGADPDVLLSLQPMIEAIYARGRYHRSIDYTRALTPALTADEQSWLAQRLQATPG